MGQLAKLTAPQPGIAHPHKRPVKQRLGEGYTNNIFLMKKAGPARLAPRSAGCHHTINRDKLSHFPPQNRSKKESDRGTRPGGGKGVHWSLTGGGDELRLPARPLLILTRFQSTLTCQGRKKRHLRQKPPLPPYGSEGGATPQRLYAPLTRGAFRLVPSPLAQWFSFIVPLGENAKNPDPRRADLGS